MSDRVFGVVGLALAAFYFWAASVIPDSFMTDVVGPRTFPYIVGAVLAITSFYFLLRPDPDPHWPIPEDLVEIFFAAAVMFLYAWVLSEVGFVISTVFATAASQSARRPTSPSIKPFFSRRRRCCRHAAFPSIHSAIRSMFRAVGSNENARNPPSKNNTS